MAPHAIRTNGAESVRPRVAIAHDYLTQRGGAERVVLSLARAFPEATIHTTLYEPATTFPQFADHDVRVSPLNRVGWLRRHHRAALPLLPLVSSRLVVDADLVIASSSGWAHGFSTSGKKIVYCYSPARWLYQTDAYLGDHSRRTTRAAMVAMGRPLRAWDQRAAASADCYLAISGVVRDRIRSVYGIEAEVVSAPVTDRLLAAESVPVAGIEPDFLLCVSRLLPYKNVGAVVAAAALRPGLRLVVVGQGPERERLEATMPANVTLLCDLTDGQLRWLYEASRGLIAASHEDFGLTPLEAALLGRPSAVLRDGGFVETMTEGETAVFFDEPTAPAIAAACDQLLARSWDGDTLVKRASSFSEDGFIASLRARAERCLSDPAVRHLGCVSDI